MLGQIEQVIHYGIEDWQKSGNWGILGCCGRGARHVLAVEPRRVYCKLPWPDAGGEAADGSEVEIFVELDGGAVLRGHGQC